MQHLGFLIRAEDALRGALPLVAKGDALDFVVLDQFVRSSAALAPMELAVTAMLGYVTANALAVVRGVVRGGSLFLPATHIIQGEKKWSASNALGRCRFFEGAGFFEVVYECLTR